jgi:hypothetical protein
LYIVLLFLSDDVLYGKYGRGDVEGQDDYKFGFQASIVGATLTLGVLIAKFILCLLIGWIHRGIKDFIAGACHLVILGLWLTIVFGLTWYYGIASLGFAIFVIVATLFVIAKMTDGEVFVVYRK